jgi:MYXO-CTERM domain-containing protein
MTPFRDKTNFTGAETFGGNARTKVSGAGAAAAVLAALLFRRRRIQPFRHLSSDRFFQWESTTGTAARLTSHAAMPR